MIFVEALGGLVIVTLIGVGVYYLVREADQIHKDRQVRKSLEELKRRVEDGNGSTDIPPSNAKH